MMDRACAAVSEDHFLTSWVWISDKTAVITTIARSEVAKGRKWSKKIRRASFRSDMSRVGSGMSERDRLSSMRCSARGESDSTMPRRRLVSLDPNDSTREEESVISMMLLLCFEANAAGLV